MNCLGELSELRGRLRQRDGSYFREVVQRVDLTQINPIPYLHVGRNRVEPEGGRRWRNSRLCERGPQRETENFEENRNSGGSRRAGRAGRDMQGILLAAVAKFSASSVRGRHYHKCLIHERRTHETPTRLFSTRTRVFACNPPRMNRTSASTDSFMGVKAAREDASELARMYSRPIHRKSCRDAYRTNEIVPHC